VGGGAAPAPSCARSVVASGSLGVVAVERRNRPCPSFRAKMSRSSPTARGHGPHMGTGARPVKTPRVLAGPVSVVSDGPTIVTRSTGTPRQDVTTAKVSC